MQCELTLQRNVRCPLWGGCKDTQCSAGGCGGSGREWEETAGGQDAQIQYNTEYKYKIHTNTNTQKCPNAKLKWRSCIHMYIVDSAWMELGRRPKIYYSA